MPFGLGRPVRSTLTLLILVLHAPLPLKPAPRAYTPLRASNRPSGSLPSPTHPHPLARPLPAPHTTAGTPKGAASAVDTTPLQVDSSGRFSLSARVLAGDYGRRCPEGMLGVASALPDTRTFTAERR